MSRTDIEITGLRLKPHKGSTGISLEEMLQERYAYPNFSSHSDERKQLAKNFSGLILSLESGGASPYIAKDLKESIASWWASYMAHMNSSDIQLAEFLKKRI